MMNRSPLPKERLLVLYEKFYFHELERKEKLDGRAPIFVGLHTALLGIAAFFANNLPLFRDSIPHRIFYMSFAAQIAALIVASIFAARYLFLSRYASMALPFEIDEYMSNIYRRNLLRPPGMNEIATEIADDLDESLTDLLLSQYGNFATWNYHQNYRKNQYFFQALTMLIVTASLAFICAVSYFTLKIHGVK